MRYNGYLMTDHTTTIATRADFDTLQEAMLEYAKFVYSKETELTPVIMILTLAERTNETEKQKFEIGIMPVGTLQHEAMGSHGKDIIAALLIRLADEPGILVAGYMSEATSTTFNPLTFNPLEQKEVIIFSLMSKECQALQCIPISRTDTGITLDHSQPMEFLNPNQDTEKTGRFIRSRPSLS